MLSTPHRCLKFSITLFIFAFIDYAIGFLQMKFTATTNSRNTFEIVDLLITKSSLHTKRLISWANLYIAQHPITIRTNFWYLVSCFISLDYKSLAMQQRQTFAI
jgi:hypothetical protein